MVGYNYYVDSMRNFSDVTAGAEYQYEDITSVDNTIDKVCKIDSADCPTLFELSSIDAYRTDEAKVAPNSFLIVDKTCSTYKKIPEDTRKGVNRELIGIMPVVTTAANAMYAQKLI
jgi:hypothetical protein